ncbi:STAM-binding protein isoform X2 [Phymastichus coffea]|nr:STAM-binding protein isoform X2 [Phymastichus coffea]
MTIFIEKLKTHPEYNSIPPLDKEYIKNTLRVILPKTEALKKKLLEQFKHEYELHKQEIEEQEKVEAERLKLEEKQRLKEEEEMKNQILATASKTSSIGIAAALTSADELKRQVFAPNKTYITSHIDDQAQSSKDRKVPSVDRSTKPTSLTSSDRLRDIIIPSRLMQNFLKLASSNTSNNIETCGILAGKLERNRLLVTHFLIPKQTGSPDSCITHNEKDIFDFQDEHNLITLGWIHTHPTQTAFLSSVDLHTHCAYQLMMAEAIAIVCAPKYDETGFFHLTPDFGLNYIANCRESGFHPHPSDSPLFTTAKHFRLDSRASIEAVDLRKK